MLQQLRVVDLAHTMGITATELIFKLRSIGVSVQSEEDTLDLSTVRSIITGETLQKRPREVIVRTETEAEDRPTSSARDRLARRRRRVVKTDDEIREVTPVKAGSAGEETEDEIGEDLETTEAELAEDVTAVEPAVELEEAPAEEAPSLDEEEAVAAPPAELETGVEAEAKATTDTPEEETPAPEKVAAKPPGEAAAAVPEAEQGIKKPQPTVTEEELTGDRTVQPEAPLRVRPVRAKTPLEQSLRELSPEEIKQRLLDQRAAEIARKKEKETRPAAGKGANRKAKSAADAKEIRDLLNKFDEQKLKGQQEGGAAPPSRPGPRHIPRPRPKKRGRRNRGAEAERRPAPRPSRTVQFKDGVKPEGPIVLSEMVTPRELAEKLNVTVKDLLGLLIQKGTMVTTNMALPHEIAEAVCADLEIDAMVATAEEVMDYEREESPEPAGPLKPRPPVVTVMGHVDHGKTSLLDSMRSSRVAEGEAGGITQHIGASRIVTDDGRVIIFVDTPGHEAFTQMRARGAQVTDIVILVVAADDGVMPQTLEAIAHAKAAGVPLIVAVNKIDKANANADRVKQQLAERDVLIEEWGGEIPAVMVSATTGQGISDLLDMILLVSEMKEFKATDEGPARGVVLEAQKEKGRGIVATVIIQHGTLNVGDFFFSGAIWGRVRAISDTTGVRLTSAGPSEPVEIMGFEDVPAAGDTLQVTDEAQAVEVASFRAQKAKEEGLVSGRKVSLENLFDHMAESGTKELNVVVKADVQGSVEVLKATLSQLGTEKVKITVLHGSVGAVTTNDVMLAAASSAIVIGFSVRPERTARDLADVEQVDIRLYTVIYDLVDDIKNAMVGLLEPVYREEVLGRAEVREIFKVPKIGSIAGSHVTEGIILRNAKVRLLRDNVVLHTGGLASLRHFKDDKSEVRQGFDCGIGLERYQDIKEGDIIEAFKMVEMAPEL